ncbi:MAG: hypothetical protein E7376_03080 [Clostridiales bacterium]|nr:hypothetical protein [Clostridiales bacterium]
MALVPAKCTQCGASVEVDNEKEAAICSHCGTAFIVEKAINNYNITNNITNHIHADVVNVVSENIDDYIRNAHAAYKFEDYKTLEENTDKILKLDPTNLDGMFYKVVILLKNILDNNNGKDMNAISSVLNYADAVFEKNYKTEDLKCSLAHIFYVYVNYENLDYAKKNLYPKLKNIIDEYSFDPFAYLSKLNNGPILKKERINVFLKMYIDKIQNLLNLDGFYFTNEYVSYGYLDDCNIYYKQDFNFRLFINNKGNVALFLTNKYDEKFFKTCKLGEITLFNNCSKFIKEKYDILINAGYVINLDAESEKALKKLKKCLNII